MKESPEVTIFKSRCFLGFARIQFSQLSFESMRENHREESHKATARLLRVFRLEGCKRYEVENFIDATIPLQDFQEAISPADASAFQHASDVRKLQLHHLVECQNGLHRISAAKEYLPFNDRWWIVRLFSQEGFHERQDLSSYTQAAFTHEQSYSDGYIFRNIRLAHRGNLYDQERMWWARLTATKQKDLRQLLKNRELTESFDRLLDFSGMWDPIQLGTLHRFHGLRCPEELLNYLRHILDVWSQIGSTASYVDNVTVRGLELRAPGVSKADLREITQNSEILSAASDAERTQAIEIFKRTKCVIPSLRAFFENQKYLEPCSWILRKLLGTCEPKRSLEEGFGARHFSRTSFLVQTSEHHVHTSPLQETSNGWARKLGYVQLWMFCLRNFPAMTEMTPRLGSRKRKAEKLYRYNQASWHRLATLAWRLGFDTEEIRRLKDQDPDRTQVRGLLQTIRPCLNTDHEAHIDRIVAVLNSMEEMPRIVKRGNLTGRPRYPPSRRCGRPYYDDHEEDKEHLFLPLLWQTVDEGNEDVDVTSLYVKRDFLYAFFGKDTVEMSPRLETLTFDFERLCGRSATQPIRASGTEVMELRRNLQITQRCLEEMSRDHEGTQRRVVELSNENHALQVQVDSEKQNLLEKQEMIADLQKILHQQTTAPLEASSSQLEEKDAQIARLEAEVLKHAELNSQLRDGRIAILETDFVGGTQAIAEPSETIASKDIVRTDLQQQMQEKDSVIAEMVERLSAKDAEIADLRQSNNSETESSDRYAAGTAERTSIFRYDHLFKCDRLPHSMLEIKARNSYTHQEANAWKGRVEWACDRFAKQVVHERYRTAQRILNLSNNDPGYLSIIHVYINDGFRVVQYWIRTAEANNFMASIPEELKGCVMTPTTENVSAPKYLMEPVNTFDADSLRANCGKSGVCFIGERSTLDQLLSASSRKRKLGAVHLPSSKR
ncbi:hypothetical protein PMIN03_012259 [Paraphaeosphaeria minitans]